MTRHPNTVHCRRMRCACARSQLLLSFLALLPAPAVLVLVLQLQRSLQRWEGVRIACHQPHTMMTPSIFSSLALDSIHSPLVLVAPALIPQLTQRLGFEASGTLLQCLVFSKET